MTPTEFQIRFHRDDKGEVTAFKLQIPTPKAFASGAPNSEAVRDQDSELRTPKVFASKEFSRAEARRIETRRQEVTIRNGEIALTGILVRPAAAEKPCPAVVFLHGSGALNRYSFGPLPDFFLSRGFAVLTYDKRGTGGSNGKVDSATLEDLANDARAAVAFLKKNGEINKIGLCGSSQGGFLAALVASANPDVAFMVDYCGMFVPVWQQELYRAEAEMRADGLAEADIAEGLAFTRKEFEVAQTGQGWEELAKMAGKEKKWWDYVTKSSSLSELQFNWRTLYSYDPSVPLGKVSCPVLALFGELDRSTPVPQTIDNMQRALEAAGNANFTKSVFPKAGHGLFESERGANSEIPMAKRLAPHLFQSITEWLQKVKVTCDQ
jgi:pimeloyl-ACP methyl ester carboxylesterase